MSDTKRSKAMAHGLAAMAEPSQMRKFATVDDGLHPIVSVQLPGGVIAQGPTVDEADVRRGSLPTDMHGNLAIDAGGKIVAGKPIPSHRKGEPDR